MKLSNLDALESKIRFFLDDEDLENEVELAIQKVKNGIIHQELMLK